MNCSGCTDCTADCPCCANGCDCGDNCADCGRDGGDVGMMNRALELIVHKRVTGIELKAGQEAQGGFRATIATFNVVDKDKEVTLAGAFPVGKTVLISAYGHASWGSWSAAVLPVGSGVIGADETHAWVDGRFWLDTDLGKQHYLAIKNSLADGADSEWSYGFTVLKSSTDEAQLAEWPGAWRILEQVEVYEASPVLLGAGVETGTEYLKSPHPLKEHGKHLLSELEGYLGHAKARVSMRAKEGRVLSEANAVAIDDVASSLEGAAVKLRSVLEAAKPKSSGSAPAVRDDAHKAAAEAVELIARGLKVRDPRIAAGAHI